MESSLPAVHALQLTELLARWGVPAAVLLGEFGLSEEALAAPGARLGLATFERLVARARELSGEPGLGFHLGLQMRISTHGDLGFAAMTASTVREALALAVRYAPTRTNVIALRLHEEAEGAAALVIEERVPLGSARDVVLLSLVVGIWQIGNALTGESLQGDVDLAFPEPDYFRRFVDFAPGAVRFGQPLNQLVFPASTLDLPLLMADPAAQRIAREQCERLLVALGQEQLLLTRVRELVPRADGGFHTLEEVARRLHVSGRTLKRKLAEQGTSYSELVDEARREAALLLVRTGDLTLEAIAERLGYSDAANFTRAFRRWTGTSPRAFRRAGGSPATCRGSG